MHSLDEWLQTVSGYTPELNVSWSPIDSTLANEYREAFARAKIEGIEAIKEEAFSQYVSQGHSVRLYDPEKLARARRNFNELVFHLSPGSINQSGEVDFAAFKRSLEVLLSAETADRTLYGRANTLSDFFSSLRGNAQEMICSSP